MKISFVIPTYNEHGNIDRLIKKINSITKEHNLTNEIIIVDDNSTDGTIDDVRNLQKTQDNIKLIVRDKLLGIGTAHIDGYNQATGDLIISMDADLQHPPEKIPEFIAKIKIGYDVVVSSRYMKGGSTETSFHNRIISKLGGIYLSLMFGIKIKDFSTGYRAIKMEVWQKIRNYRYSSKNVFLIESVYYAHKNGAKITDIPILFKKRDMGESKTPFIRESIKSLMLPFKVIFSSIKRK